MLDFVVTMSIHEQDLDLPPTRRDVISLRDELCSEIAASRDELRAEILANRDEMRRYIDILVENFRSEFKNLFDWTQATTSTMGARIDRLEDERHGRR